MSSSEKEVGKMEIKLSTLWAVFKKFLIVILLSSVLLGVVGGVYTFLFTKPRYSASVEFMVVNVLDDNPYIADSMLGAASDIAYTCTEIVNKNVFLSKVVEKHKLGEFFGTSNYEAINKITPMISAESGEEGSSVFTLKVTSDDVDSTFKVISALRDVMPSVVEEMYKISEESSITTTIKPVKDVLSRDDIIVSKASMVKYSAIGFMFGLVVSYAICLFIFVKDTKVYNESTLKDNFSEPVLGSIPSWEDPKNKNGKKRKNKNNDLILGKRDYENKLLCETTPFAITEAFNTLRTNLCYATVDEKCPVYAITSDFSGAGKSIISTNLAISLASLGKKTLLIDCDLRRPELSEIFPKNNNYGLSDYLAGEVREQDKIFSDVEKENLNVIFSGKIPPNPSELLGSELMRKLIKECKEKYDVIIIDTPPAFEVSDVGVLSDFVTGTILVARSYHSDIQALKVTSDLISGVNGRVLGFVINDVDYKVSGYYKNKLGHYSQKYGIGYSNLKESNEK